ncbi:MAG: putative Ig domain-containing protein, partial [Bacteroidota bacterium]|nr:putative Ig domain-containing protein [Bacteroidota bacterium]
MSTKKKISILLLVVFSILMTDSGLLFSFGQKKSVVHNDIELYTPAPKLQPRINGPLVYGCRPGHPFLYRIPCQGERPIRFSVKGLPSGLKLNSSTGIITGTVPSKGEYEVIIQASNSKGKDKRNFKIVAGDKLALTPPMGWNHWYAHYDRITDKMMREAADIMISSGMADVGYQYVNIDDCWMNAPKNNDPKRVGPLRDEKGNILPNSYFPDMKGLTDYIHTKGLKAGIYTSPGPLTCGGFAGAYQHEEQDALQFAAWGFDFLKHDWCSYDKVPENDKSLEAYQKPYRQMGNILKSLDRDIVFNLCQYGMGDVWKWGAEVRVYHMWNESLLGVARNDIQRHKLIFSKPTISPPGSFGKKDYIIWNTREGMTKPGRWYLDRTAGRLVYWPLESEDMARMKIIAPKIEQIIRIAGDPDKKAENITIRGLTLQATTIPLKSAGFGGSAFDGALSMINTHQCILEGLEISNVGGVGISAIQMTDCRIIDCHIHNTGACGVKFNNSSDL